MKRIIITGSRSLDLSLQHLDCIFNHYCMPFMYGRQIGIVAGDANGVDHLAKKFATIHMGFEEHCIVKFTEMHADWDKYGKSVGPIRSREMAEYSVNQYMRS